MVEDGGTRIARRFIEAIPLAKALEMRLVRVGDGAVEIAMPWAAALAGDSQSGVIHGGAVSALLDTACGAAVMSRPDRPATTATLDLRIEHLRHATPGQELRAVATCRHVTPRIIFVGAHAWDDDEAQPFATATGAFTHGS